MSTLIVSILESFELDDDFDVLLVCSVLHDLDNVDDSLVDIYLLDVLCEFTLFELRQSEDVLYVEVEQFARRERNV